MTPSNTRRRLGDQSVPYKPAGLSCEEFIRQEIEYYERQAAKTRQGLSEHLRRMHAFYLGLARHRRHQLARLGVVDAPDPERPAAGEADGASSRTLP